MRRFPEILVHILFWIVFTLLTLILSKVYLEAKPDAPFSRHLVTVIAMELCMGLLFFYLTFFGVRWAKKRPVYFILLAALLLSLLVFFALPAIPFGMWQVMSSIIPHLILILLAVIFRRFSDSLRLEYEKRELSLQNIRSEMALLRMQLSPHFLFNTLNNIDYLVCTAPEQASAAIARLGDMMRYMIYDSAAEKIPLDRELRYMEDYISLLRMRSPDPDFIRFSVTGQAGNLLIAPALFIPLVENAYKYASPRTGAGVIRISIELQRSSIHFHADNLYDETMKNIGSGGMGLSIVKRRLELLYPARYTYATEKKNNRYMVSLNIEPDEDPLYRG